MHLFFFFFSVEIFSFIHLLVCSNKVAAVVQKPAKQRSGVVVGRTVDNDAAIIGILQQLLVARGANRLAALVFAEGFA